MNEPLMTITEVRDALRVSHRTITRLVDSGALRALKIGAQWRFDRQDVERYIAESAVEARKGSAGRNGG